MSSGNHFLKLSASVMTYDIVPYLDPQSICRMDTALRSCRPDRTNSMYHVPLRVKDTAYCEKNRIPRIVYSIFHEYKKYILESDFLKSKEIFVVEHVNIPFAGNDRDELFLRINGLNSPISIIDDKQLVLHIQLKKNPLSSFVLIIHLSDFTTRPSYKIEMWFQSGQGRMLYYLDSSQHDRENCYCSGLSELNFCNTSSKFELANGGEGNDSKGKFLIEPLLSSLFSNENRYFQLVSKKTSKLPENPIVSKKTSKLYQDLMIGSLISMSALGIIFFKRSRL